MKLLVLASLLVSASIPAQEMSAENKAATETNAAPKRLLEAEQKTKKLENPLFYGGFLVDLSSTGSVTRVLSLRRPVDPKEDYKNLRIDERSGRTKGVVLFSLSF